MRNETFKRIDNPYVHGYEAQREDGLTVEIVRLYQNEWDVFLVAPDEHGIVHPVACPLPLPGYRPHENMPKWVAVRLARHLL
ncbi:MAG: hypothetical protein ACYSVY_25620 [Planctomycetota bacterium]|jgi:deoxyinosine 3'endonuclease (endonuclease V)